MKKTIAIVAVALVGLIAGSYKLRQSQRESTSVEVKNNSGSVAPNLAALWKSNGLELSPSANEGTKVLFEVLSELRDQEVECPWPVRIIQASVKTEWTGKHIYRVRLERRFQLLIPPRKAQDAAGEYPVKLRAVDGQGKTDSYLLGVVAPGTTNLNRNTEIADLKRAFETAAGFTNLVVVSQKGEIEARLDELLRLPVDSLPPIVQENGAESGKIFHFTLRSVDCEVEVSGGGAKPSLQRIALVRPGR